MDYRTTDEGGQLAHERAKVSTLKINQQTGAISGQGPGWIRSVRLSSGGDSLGALSPGSADEPAAAEPGLRFLRVNFQRGLTGNLHERSVRFHERVRAVYGPVLAWDHTLPVESPTGVPPDAVELACDELRVHEDPASRFVGGQADRSLGAVEIRALGRVRIEGAQGDEGGSFTAEATAASYTQLKEVFVLEGDSTRNATLWLRQTASQEPARSVARKISYNRLTGRVKAEDIRGFDYQATPQPPTRR